MKRKDGFKEFFISRFVLILICVVVAEYAVKFLLDYSMMPILQNWFFEGLKIEGALSIVDIMLFGLFLLVEVVLGAIKMLLPDTAEQIWDDWLERVKAFGVQMVPDIAGDYSIDQLTPLKAILLVCLIFAAIFLFLLPLATALRTFIHMVDMEVIHIQRETEEFYRESEKNKNLLLSDIAHDLRTPITTISGYAKALNDGMVTDEQKRAEYLEAIVNKSDRMNELITLLFDYVRLGTEGFQLKKEPVDLAELLRENAALAYADVEEQGMEFYINIPDRKCMVTADKIQMSRVITNLLGNAIRHNETGTCITLELRDEGDHPEILIADDGAEIEAAVAEHIFEPFVVGDRSRRTKGGSGLGLSIAKKIVQMHGWDIKLLQNRRGFKKVFVIKANK